MNVDRAPWREDSPGGGGYVYQSKRRGPSDYGAVEDKFLSILFLKYIFNSDEQAVIKAECFAFYKGKLVVRTNMERSGSFGIIFFSRKENGHDTAADVLRHEYGHTVQLDILGEVKYFFCIGIPSYFEWGNASYYDRPQEITANIFGNASLGDPTDTQIMDGYKYLRDSYYYGIFAWAMYDWG